MRFSIRDLLLVTVIMAMAAGWWVDRWRQTERYNRLLYMVDHYEAIPFDSNGEVMVSPEYPKPPRR